MAETMSEILNPASASRDPDFPLQGYFAAHERPNVRELHDALDESFHARGGLRYLYTLFPGGPVAQGCRFAGLKAPSGAADKSFGSVQ